MRSSSGRRPAHAGSKRGPGDQPDNNAGTKPGNASVDLRNATQRADAKDGGENRFTSNEPLYGSCDSGAYSHSYVAAHRSAVDVRRLRLGQSRLEPDGYQISNIDVDVSSTEEKYDVQETDHTFVGGTVIGHRAWRRWLCPIAAKPLTGSARERGARRAVSAWRFRKQLG